MKVIALLVNAEIEIEKLHDGNLKTYLILYAINKLAALSKVVNVNCVKLNVEHECIVVMNECIWDSLAMQGVQPRFLNSTPAHLGASVSARGPHP